VRLCRVAADLRPLILAKVEYLNPGGSVKDRIAVGMVQAAEAAGALRPGGTIVEPTSGNTGVGLAMVAALRGYHCVFTCPDKVSLARIDLLRAYGAQVVVCPAAAPQDDPAFYRNVAATIAASLPGACLLDQYSNAANPQAHYLGTGPEIWRQTEGKVTHFVAGLGTGGTLSGAGRYLKEVSDGNVAVIGVDPDGSRYTGPALRPYLLEGVGQPSLPRAYDAAVADHLVTITDAEAFAMTLRLAREEAILAGGSGGMAVAGALNVAAGLGAEAVVVVIVPDSGRGYLSKIFNDDWMLERGFSVQAPGGPSIDPWLQGKADLVRRDAVAGLPVAAAARGMVVLSPAATVGEAIEALRRHELPALPVTAADPPVRLAEVVGMAVADELVSAVAGGRVAVTDPVGRHLRPQPAFAGAQQPLARAAELLGSAEVVLAVDRGLVCGMVTRADIEVALQATNSRRNDD
jgi:cystathionine beta-synthase